MLREEDFDVYISDKLNSDDLVISDEEFAKYNNCELAKMKGVSDITINNRRKERGIESPGRVYNK